MEEGRHKEETRYEEQNLVTRHPSLSPSEPHTRLMITDGKNGNDRHMFYSFRDDHNFVRLVQELEYKNVACCCGGWLILSDNFTYDCSILNILTMEKLELPPLPSEFCTDFIMSSPVMDRSCRVIFIERDICTYIRTFWSCHLGDSEFIEQELRCEDESISDYINFKGKLCALTARLNLIAFDFSDPDFDYEHVISGDSLFHLSSVGRKKNYLVESCEDLLLICIWSYNHEVSDVQVFKAEFSTGEWVEMEALDDRTIFLGSRSSPATTTGMKGNAIYWLTTPFSQSPTERRLYMYDIIDKSISMSLLDPIVPSLFAVSFPMTRNEDKRSKQKATIMSTSLETEQRKTEEIEITMVRKENLWADLPAELLLEIFPHLFAGDSVAFRSVCKSWYSISSPSTSRTIPLLTSLDLSSPFLTCLDNPIHGTDFLPGAKVRAMRDGWLLMDSYSAKLFFYNPFTKRKIFLPMSSAKKYYSVCFSAPPTSTDCLVVVAAKWFVNSAIYFMNIEDEGWTCHEILPFRFSYCNAIAYRSLYYFLGKGADVGRLLIFNPKKEEQAREIEAPNFFHEREFQCEEQYMLESDDGKLLAVFVGVAGNSVYTCEWNVATSKWKILRSLGNIMLFVSRPLSMCKRATVRGTGNKIYFPRLVCDGQILFYSLATKRYHTFEMGTSYSNFSASKYYPKYNGWFMP